MSCLSLPVSPSAAASALCRCCAIDQKGEEAESHTFASGTRSGKDTRWSPRCMCQALHSCRISDRWLVVAGLSGISENGPLSGCSGAFVDVVAVAGATLVAAAPAATAGGLRASPPQLSAVQSAVPAVFVGFSRPVGVPVNVWCTTYAGGSRHRAAW